MALDWESALLSGLRTAGFEVIDFGFLLGGRHAGLFDYGDLFLYKNRVSAERLLSCARLWCLVSWTLLLFPAIFSKKALKIPG